jgi:hypothetical protein
MGERRLMQEALFYGFSRAQLGQEVESSASLP